MESFISAVDRINTIINSFVWGVPMCALILLVGLYFTIRSGFFQIRKISLWMNKTIIAFFKNKDVTTSGEKSISQFQALSTALAGTIGTGNIAGVATALVAGGPGAIFWMWLSAFFGMMTHFAETVLAVHFRYKNEKGEWMSGPMVYIERGLGQKWLAILFSIFCVLASFGIGNMTQANSIASALQASFNVPPLATGIFISVTIALVILGGIKRIGLVAEKVVPFMALFYISGGIAIIILNIKNVPTAFELIFKNAFSMQSIAGGTGGYMMMQAMRFGIARGIFSNEAGLGSSAMVHSASNVEEPVEQGLWGIFEVFVDTMVVCTITALLILTSGVYSVNLDGTIQVVAKGAALASAAFGSLGILGGAFVAIALTLFAFTTILGWSYYGERGIEYLFGLQYLIIYKIIFIGMIIIGCVSSLDLVWNLSDTFNGLMSIPNLIGIVLLSGTLFKITKEYLKKDH